MLELLLQRKEGRKKGIYAPTFSQRNMNGVVKRKWLGKGVEDSDFVEKRVRR